MWFTQAQPDVGNYQLEFQMGNLPNLESTTVFEFRPDSSPEEEFKRLRGLLDSLKPRSQCAISSTSGTTCPLIHRSCSSLSAL